MVRVPLARSLLVALALAVVAPVAFAKEEKKKPAPLETGLFNWKNVPATPNVAVSVPKDYDPAKYYPLLLVLHPTNAKPDAYVREWAKVLDPKGWIVAGPELTVWNSDVINDPIRATLGRVVATYRVDQRRVLLAGHNAGATVGWHYATTFPDHVAGVLAFSGEVDTADRSNLKKMVGKAVYLFRGSKDVEGYPAASFERDKKLFEAWKIGATCEVKKDWGFDFPTPALKAIADWVDAVRPPGGYLDAANAVEKALDAKEPAAAFSALEALKAELRKTPYPAFEAKVPQYDRNVADLVREAISAAKGAVSIDPLEALAKLEALAGSLKGLKPYDAEASAALAAARKDPGVTAALRKKEAETKAASYMEKAQAAEAKGDFAKALDWYRRVSALGDTSRKAEADAKITELEPKAGGG
jgi:pimeloyl-ACP methyl ester carboxylesterase